MIHKIQKAIVWIQLWSKLSFPCIIYSEEVTTSFLKYICVDSLQIRECLLFYVFSFPLKIVKNFLKRWKGNKLTYNVSTHQWFFFFSYPNFQFDHLENKKLKKKKSYLMKNILLKIIIFKNCTSKTTISRNNDWKTTIEKVIIKKLITWKRYWFKKQ